ncbi:hypothetical protein BRIN106911_08085 [Brevibacillus invocatus]
MISVEVEFVPDSTGTAEKMIIHEPEKEIHAIRMEK